MESKYDYQFLTAYGEAVATGLIRQSPEDFFVEEELSFEPIGKGDHIYLWIEKTGCNTAWVADQLVRLSELKPVDVGYAGLKDRHAVTRQWFSLHMPNRSDVNWAALPEGVRVIQETRHTKKLKIGAIKKNKFELCIHEFETETSSLDERLNEIKQKGIPNYFGPQRFGRNNANVQRFVSLVGARKRLKRDQKGILLSAARSYLFNHVLSLRIQSENWNQIIEGDVLMLNGSKSIFSADALDESLSHRVEELDIHPTAVLWGKGEIKNTGPSLEIIMSIINRYPEICQSLEKLNVELGYRSLRSVVNDLKWKQNNDQLTISFSLISGAYATSVLREFLNFDALKENE